MPNLQAESANAAVVSATATGIIGVADTLPFFPGAKAWVYKTDASASARVLIVKIVSGTLLQVRRFTNDDDHKPMYSYGFSNMASFNAGSAISMESQVVPVDPTYVKHNIP